MPVQTTYPLNQPAGFPGMMGNMEEWNGSTKTANATILFGEPVQRVAGGICAPLASGGEYIGVAAAHHVFTGTNGDSYGQYDNVPVVDEMGRIGGLADAAIAEGAGLNWNTVSKRWTTAATSGTVIAVPGSEADTAASGAGAFFWVRLRRIPS